MATLIESKSTQYFELMAKSNFSFLEGASHPEEMVRQALQLNYSGLALMDTNGMYGVVRGFQEVARPSHFAAENFDYSQFKYMVGSTVVTFDSSPIGVLPINLDGYQRLCRVLSKAKMQSEKGTMSVSYRELITQADECLFFPTLPLSLGTLEFMLNRCGTHRVFLPVRLDRTWQSLQDLALVRSLERNYGVLAFATQQPLMHSRQRKNIQDVLTCLLHKTTLDEAETRLLCNADRSLLPLEELQLLFQKSPQYLAHTQLIAQKVDFSLTELRYHYPRSRMPVGMTPADYLRTKVKERLPRRFPNGASEAIKLKIKHELKLIQDMQYEDYFLTLSEICDFAEQKGILFQGRGSAANSVVCYVLGLTAVNPLQVDLMFERFISKERGEPPDIDVDFEHERREEVIQHVYQTYGHQHAAMVCTVIRFKSKMSLRECGKVFGIAKPTLDKLIKYMGRDGYRRIVDNSEICQSVGMAPERFQLLLETAMELRGFPRHLGIHTGGFVISNHPIQDICPTERATMVDRYVIQWNKDDLATLGLMKVDLLSLGMLSAVRKCFASLKDQTGIDLSMYNLPSDDRATYQMIQEADTVGVFQIESRAQMSSLPRSKPNTFYDLVTQVAIIRPGPLQGGMVHPFLRRKQGQEPVEYAHPDLVPILKKTMGVPIFQEQIMRMVVAVAGFSPGEADELRRIMSSASRKQEQMDHLRTRLINGMLTHGLTQEYALQVYQVIEGFSSYGFPESHAASFALITYASCYLKKHYPAYFTVALLNSQPMGFYSPRSLLQDAHRHGICIQPLHLNFSTWDYQVINQEILVGFRAIAGLSKEAIEKICSDRESYGAFSDLKNFVQRCSHLRKADLVRLAAAGVFSCFGLSPRQALWTAQSIDLAEDSLFFAQDHSTVHSVALPSETRWQNLLRNYDSMGFSVFDHPIGILREHLQNLNTELLKNRYVPYTDSHHFLDQADAAKVRVVGLLCTHQRPPTAKGVCFLTLEDEKGLINVVVPKDVYERDRMVIYEQPFIEVHAKLQKRHGVINLQALKLKGFDTSQS